MKLLCSLFLLFFAVTLSAQQVPKLRIDPAHAYGGTVSEYFDSVEYIPLETTKESLFGDITQLVITDSSFVILDKDTKAILFFNLRGKFISKIKFNREGGIFYEKEKNRIKVAFKRENEIEINYYSIIGKSLNSETTTIMNIGDFLQTLMLPLGDGYFLNTNSFQVGLPSRAKDTTINLVDVYHNGHLYKSLLPYNQLKNALASALVGTIKPFGPEIKKGIVYAATPLTHDIYQISKDTAIKLFRVIFPAKRSLSKKVIFSKNKKMLDSLAIAFMNNRNIIPAIGNIFFDKHLFFFKIYVNNYISTTSSESLNQYHFFYDTVTHQLVSLERMNPGITTNYLPFFQNKGPMPNFLYRLGTFYSTISSFKMFAAHEKNKARNPQYTPTLQQYFATQNRRSNPVIVKMKLKDF